MQRTQYLHYNVTQQKWLKRAGPQSSQQYFNQMNRTHYNNSSLLHGFKYTDQSCSLKFNSCVQLKPVSTFLNTNSKGLPLKSLSKPCAKRLSTSSKDCCQQFYFTIIINNNKHAVFPFYVHGIVKWVLHSAYGTKFINTVYQYKVEAIKNIFVTTTRR